MSVGIIAAHAVIGGGGGGGGGYSAAVLADTPLGYWRQGDASGTTMTDSSGNSRNGTYSGGVTLGATGLLTGDSDTCANYDGTSGHAVIAHAAWQDQSAFTIEALINPAAVAGGCIAAHYGSSASWLMRLESGKVSCYIYNGNYVVVRSTTTCVVGTKYHVAFTSSGATGIVYVNGTAEASLAMSGMWLSTDAMTIASNSVSGEWFNGKIDEVAFYGSALSSTRIAAHSAAA